MAWLREDGLHKLTTRLARENAVVVIEDLNVKGMGATGGAHKRGLNRSLADASFGQFRRMLQYKGSWYGAGDSCGGPLVSVVKDVLGVRCSENQTPALRALVPV